MDIHCKWIEDDGQMLVGVDGQILPCCYLSGWFKAGFTPVKTREEWERDDFDEVKDQLYHIDLVNVTTHNEYIYQEYQKRKDKLNIFTNSLEDILANDWFTEILPKSWEDENLISSPCRRICDKCNDTV